MNFEGVIKEIKISDDELNEIKDNAEKLMRELESRIKKKKIKADVFLGGSLAKGTIIKKDKHDIDIFVRFDRKYDDEKLSSMLAGIVNGKRIHGSRDYWQIKKGNIVFEIIPVRKISKPKEARNITDLSYFHVSYILKQIKRNPKLADEIMLAKAFCYAQRCYGAESYIRGFSGYALELLICYYGSFLNFVKSAVKDDKRIIDSENRYKNKDVESEMNEAKLSSPIVLVDPTFKERNALAALSNETYSRFREACKRFLKNPSNIFFQQEKIDERKFNLIIETETGKQEGDIAGSKLLKFFRFLSSAIEKNFLVERKNFDYAFKGRNYFMIKKKEIILTGPPVEKSEHAAYFRKKHKNVFVKNGRIFAREKSLSFPEFMKKFLKDSRKVMKDMGISKIRVVKS